MPSLLAWDVAMIPLYVVPALAEIFMGRFRLKPVLPFLHKFTASPGSTFRSSRG